MKYAKLINGILEYANIDESGIGFINDTNNPTEAMLFSWGYKSIVEPIIPAGKIKGEPIENAYHITWNVIDKPALNKIQAELSFNYLKAINDISTVLDKKYFDYRIDKGLISQSLQMLKFELLKSYLETLVTDEILLNSDYTLIEQVLLTQYIDLKNY